MDFLEDSPQVKGEEAKRFVSCLRASISDELKGRMLSAGVDIVFENRMWGPYFDGFPVSAAGANLLFEPVDKDWEYGDGTILLQPLWSNCIRIEFSPLAGAAYGWHLTTHMHHPSELSELIELFLAPDKELLCPFREVAFGELVDLFFVFKVRGVCHLSKFTGQLPREVAETCGRWEYENPISEEETISCMRLFDNIQITTPEILREGYIFDKQGFSHLRPWCLVGRQSNFTLCMVPKKNKCAHLFISELLLDRRSRSSPFYSRICSEDNEDKEFGIRGFLSQKISVPVERISQIRCALEVKRRRFMIREHINYLYQHEGWFNCDRREKNIGTVAADAKILERRLKAVILTASREWSEKWRSTRTNGGESPG